MKVIIKTDEMSGYRYRQQMLDAGFAASDLAILPAAGKVEISVKGCVKKFRAWLKQQQFNATVKP